MSITTIPVVIIHRKYKNYLKKNLQITGCNNKIYLIGDNSIENLGSMDNVTFVNINKYDKDPFINKSKFNLIKDKINYHKKKKWKI